MVNYNDSEYNHTGDLDACRRFEKIVNLYDKISNVKIPVVLRVKRLYRNFIKNPVDWYYSELKSN